jgi:alpha 1,3-glucosidase
VRSAVKARYSLLPYWYTLFFLSEQSGMPIIRPLWVEFPTDKQTFATDNSHLVGV